MTLQLLHRYRYLLRPLQVQVRPIQKIMSSQPQILSIEDLNTADAKYGFERQITGPALIISFDISVKVGQPEED